MKNFILASLVITLCVIGINSAQASTDRTVTVFGQGTVKFNDDLATADVTLSTTKPSVSAAHDDLASIFTKVQGALKSLGKNTLTSSNFSIYPNYDYSNNSAVKNGYTARYSLQVKTTIDNLGAAVSTLVSSGGDNLTVDQFEFSSSKNSSLTAQAQKLAIKDAYQRAVNYTSAAGAKVGAVVSISEQNSGPIISPKLFAASTAPSGNGIQIPVAPASDSIQVSVQVSYLIK